MNLIFIVFLFFISFCHGNESAMTSFENIHEISDSQEIEIRGFLYQSDKGLWILGAEPNLKSCCVGSAHKASSQIALSGTYQKGMINKILHVRGILQRNTTQEGPRYRMDDVKAIEPNKSIPWLTLAIVFLIGLFCLLIFNNFIISPSTRVAK
jgi:hypothetical protein